MLVYVCTVVSGCVCLRVVLFGRVRLSSFVVVCAWLRLLRLFACVLCILRVFAYVCVCSWLFVFVCVCLRIIVFLRVYSFMLAYA